VSTNEQGGTSTDEEPVARSRAGAVALPVAHPDGAALGEDEFVALYPALHRFAGITADLDLDPDDLVQEALTRFLRARASRPVEQPDAYLRRTIVNLVVSHRRATGLRRSSPRRVVDREAQSDVYPSDHAALLDRVNPVDRALLTMTVLEGRPIGDAARVLGLSAPAARARLSRAKRALRSEDPR